MKTNFPPLNFEDILNKKEVKNYIETYSNYLLELLANSNPDLADKKMLDYFYQEIQNNLSSVFNPHMNNVIFIFNLYEKTIELNIKQMQAIIPIKQELKINEFDIDSAIYYMLNSCFIRQEDINNYIDKYNLLLTNNIKTSISN